MIKKFNTRCGMSPKTWALIMAIGNLQLGIAIIIGGNIWITHNHRMDKEVTYYFNWGFLVGIIGIVAGCILFTAIVQGKEGKVLLYIRLEYLFIILIPVYVALNLYYYEFSMIMFGLLAFCPFLWIGLFNVYPFYHELYEYNNGAARAGVEEIVCNTHKSPSIVFPEKAMDTTTV